MVSIPQSGLRRFEPIVRQWVSSYFAVSIPQSGLRRFEPAQRLTVLGAHEPFQSPSRDYAGLNFAHELMAQAVGAFQSPSRDYAGLNQASSTTPSGVKWFQSPSRDYAGLNLRAGCG